MTKFLLDSGDPNEYKEIVALAHEKGQEIWGATTNPSLIAKKLAGQKVTPEIAFKLQKDIVAQILALVPGAVSAEVYADTTTTSDQMVQQGREIASWHERVFVKLPTTFEGFKARTVLRKEGVSINNTLVFSQEQVFAICLHEKLLQESYSIRKSPWPPFISPFLGRLDDQGQDGLNMLANSLKTQNTYFPEDQTWLLSSSIRTLRHLQETIRFDCDIITAPAKVYREYFTPTHRETPEQQTLQPIPYWTPPANLLDVQTLEEFMHVLEKNILSINHPLTQKGIEKFTADWKAILA